MKKWLAKLAALISGISFVLPTAACTFNSYVDVSKKRIINEFANQTSSVIKSLVLSKEKNFATTQTINDMLNDFSNIGINNNTNNASTPQAFINNWGYNNKISTSNFNINDYFLNSGSITNQVNNYKNINSTLSSLSYLLAFGVVNNPLLVNVLQTNAGVKSAITDFITQSQLTDPSKITSNLKSVILLLKNMIVGPNWSNYAKSSQFENNFLNPLSDVFNYLVDGQWAVNQPSPNNLDDFVNFMDNWKDSDGNYYSEWTNSGEGDWKSAFNNDSSIKKWTIADYNNYRVGTLLNYTFYKIGKDYNIDQNYNGGTYLGSIISNNLSISDVSGSLNKILTEIKKLLPYIIENPHYVITLINAALPLIKNLIIGTDAQNKVNNLTFGKIYPSDPQNNSYNVGTIINKISTFFNSSDWINKVINYIYDVIGLNGDTTATRLLGDIEITLSLGIINYHGTLPYIINLVTGFLPNIKTDIETAIKNIFVNPTTNQPTALSNEIVNGVNSVKSVYDQWIKQYNDNGTGININLKKLQTYLFNPSNGLLNIINKQVSDELYTIFTKNTFKETDYAALFTSLGIQFAATPGGTIPNNFSINSTISTLLNAFNDNTNAIRQLIIIILGTSSPVYQGLTTFITNDLNNWIFNNYSKFFDSDNNLLGKITNAKMDENKVSGGIENVLSYNLSYTINNKTYKFYIVCVSSAYQPNNPPGEQNFKFKEIKLLAK